MRFNRIRASFSNPELRSKLLFTLAILLIFRIGVQVSVPGVNIEQVRNATTGSAAGIFGVLNLFGGGGLQNYSIFALGVGPYITSSIIIQLLAMDIVPYFTDLQNGGEVGRKKLSQITRYVTIGLSFVQGYVLTLGFSSQYALVSNPTPLKFIQISLIMTAGAMFILWLADQITAKGIGNGTSMIIFAGIVDKVPKTFTSLIEGFFKTPDSNVMIATLLSIAVIILFLAIVVFTVFTQQATRKIPVQYASNSPRKGETTYLPFKINVAGVVPVIFASALMMVPTIFINLMGDSDIKTFLLRLFNYSDPLGLIVYIILIFVFTYFYANLQVDSKKLSDNLGRSGGYILGVRPGQETITFINKTVNKLNFLGASSLALIAATPIIIPLVTNITKSQAYGIGGTGLIIVVGVAIEVVNRIDSIAKVKAQRSFIR